MRIHLNHEAIYYNNSDYMSIFYNVKEVNVIIHSSFIYVT